MINILMLDLNYLEKGQHHEAEPWNQGHRSRQANCQNVAESDQGGQAEVQGAREDG